MPRTTDRTQSTTVILIRALRAPFDLLAHGGVAGAVVELSLVGVVFLVAAVRERRKTPEERRQAALRDDEPSG